MSPNESIDFLLSIAQKLFGFRTELSKSNQEKKERVSEYFFNLSKTIENIVENIKKNEVPYGACYEIYKHSELLPDVVKGIIPEEDATKYAVALYQSYVIEELFGEEINELSLKHHDEYYLRLVRSWNDSRPEFYKEQIRKLQEVGGLFRALGTATKV